MNNEKTNDIGGWVFAIVSMVLLMGLIHVSLANIGLAIGIAVGLVIFITAGILLYSAALSPLGNLILWIFFWPILLPMALVILLCTSVWTLWKMFILDEEIRV